MAVVITNYVYRLTVLSVRVADREKPAFKLKTALQGFLPERSALTEQPA